MINRLQVWIMLIMLLKFGYTVNAQVKYEIYVASSLGFSVSYPSSWEYVSNPRTAFIFMRPIDEQGQIFRENINLILTPASGHSLDSHAEASRRKMVTYLQNFKEVSFSKKTINGDQYVRIVFTHTLNDLSLKVVCYISVKEDKVYSFTCSALESTFLNFEPIFIEIVSSFKSF